MLLFAHLGLALLIARPFKRIDLAFLAVGSMLPDIIDKPLGFMIFGTMNHGRIFAHTLLFLLVLAALAVSIRDIRLASLGAGVLIHLALDLMWNSPVILLWPLLGSFPPADYIDALSYVQMLLQGLRDPGILVPECLGLGYLIYFASERSHGINIKIRSKLVR